MRATDALGDYGERVAARALAEAGMEILARNWRCRWGELDLVARDGDELVFIEVKTRRSTAYGSPAESVTPVKLRRLRGLAGAWLAAHAVHAKVLRIDVVAVQLPRRGAAVVEHLRGVA